MIDLAIIGGGPAGLAAAVYAARAGLDFAVLEQDGYGGGQITSAHLVQNYPGIPEISGPELGELFRSQAVKLGAEIRFAEVESIRQEAGHFLIQPMEEAPLAARAVIAATGATPRPLNLPGETEHIGAGLSYCATCDGAFYAKRDVLVIGGGDTAVEDGLYLSSLCRSVTLVLRGERFRGTQSRVELLKRLPNVSVLYNTRPAEILDGAVRLSGPSGEEIRKADGVFVAVGSLPATGWLEGLPLTLENGYVPAPETGETPVPGLFAAGDIRKKPLRQVATAVSDGANAAASAIRYLSGRSQ